MIVVQYAAQDISPLDRTSLWRMLQRHRTLLVNALMRTSVIDIGNVFLQDPRTMPLVDDQQVVQTFLPHRPRPALRNRMGFRCPVRRTHEGTTRGSEHRAEGRRKRGVPVVDQEAYGQRVILDVPAEVTCLLRDPRRRPRSMKKSTAMVFSQTGSAVKTAHARIGCCYCVRKVRQLLPSRARCGTSRMLVRVSTSRTVDRPMEYPRLVTSP